MFADWPEPLPLPRFDTPQRIWRWRDIGAGFLLVALAVLAIGAVLVVTGARGDNALLVATIAQEVMLGGAVLVLAARRRISLRALGFVRPRKWSPLTSAWLGSYGILIVYGIALLVLDGLGLDVSALRGTNSLPIDSSTPTARIVVLAFTVVLIAPFSEELFFRGLLYRGLRGLWTRLPALIVSGICFGLLHLSLGVIVPFALIGVLFAWSNDQSGSLWTSIIAHGLVNGLSFALSVAGVGAQ
jgi:membrane protease YdiL (CAAX protease family)